MPEVKCKFKSNFGLIIQDVSLSKIKKVKLKNSCLIILEDPVLLCKFFKRTLFYLMKNLFFDKLMKLISHLIKCN